MTDLLDGLETPPVERPNRLYYGDNLTIMRSMPNACVDLIYLDPPFNSQRTYNLIYKELTGLPVPEQEEAFCDAWELDPEKEEMARNMPVMLQTYGVADDVVQFWTAWIKALRTTQPALLAYLVYMTYRLFEMRRVLKPSGSIYLHCDPAASHYIKVMMDGVFGHTNFRSEIIWKRSSAHSDTKQGRKIHGHIHDVILFYTKSNEWTWNPIYTPYDDEYLGAEYRHVSKTGKRFKQTDLTAAKPGGDVEYDWRVKRSTDKGGWMADLTDEWQTPVPGWEYKAVRPYAGRYWAYSKANLRRFAEAGSLHHRKTGMPRLMQLAEEMPGIALQDIWTDIRPIGAQAEERLGYPTQKPLALLDRIVKSSSNEGDVVFDPFCGCGTAVYAAHLNNRRWVGCDIAILSIRIVRDVLRERYGLQEGEHYEVDGVPLSIDGARYLAERDKRQFQHWVVELAGGFCNTRHSGDHGIDGRLYFETRDGLRSMVMSVKGGGHLTPAFVRELRGTLEADPTAEMAGFICLEEPTKGMVREAAKAGMYRYLDNEYPRVQIRTVEELLQAKGFLTPARVKPLNWEHQTKLPL